MLELQVEMAYTNAPHDFKKLFATRQTVQASYLCDVDCICYTNCDP